jgi:hypothetical protein
MLHQVSKVRLSVVRGIGLAALAAILLSLAEAHAREPMTLYPPPRTVYRVAGVVNHTPYVVKVFYRYGKDRSR